MKMYNEMSKSNTILNLNYDTYANIFSDDIWDKVKQDDFDITEGYFIEVSPLMFAIIMLIVCFSVAYTFTNLYIFFCCDSNHNEEERESADDDYHKMPQLI